MFVRSNETDCEASGRGCPRGSASVEQVGLCALIALVLLAGISSLAAGENESGHELGLAIARRIACGPRVPDSCHHHPLVPAYGWPLARLVRFLAPAPSARAGPDGQPLVPVDFRYCRRASCAVSDGDPHLTSAGRRTTAFTSVEDRRRGGGEVIITYWLYRPSLGWSQVVRTAGAADIDMAAGTEVLKMEDPALVPLEILPGRDSYEFPAGEQPPWHIQSTYPGWSA